jgi:hypothetical protein
MLTATHPRLWLWICRLLPFAFWCFWLVPLVSPQLLTGPEPYRFPPDLRSGFAIPLAIALLLTLSSAAYLLLICFVFPRLIFPDGNPGFCRLAGYLRLAVFTAGLGPYLWYLLSIDPILGKMAQRSTSPA